MTFPTTANALTLSLLWEGEHKPEAWLDTLADPPVWTVGKGLTKIRDKVTGQWRKVLPSDRIPDPEDADREAQAFIDELIIPELASIFDGADIQPNQGDALVSMAYNMGSFSFPKTAQLIKDKAPISEVQAEWVHSDINWNDHLGLYRRRLTEALVAAGWTVKNAYEATKKAKWGTEISDLMLNMPIDPDLGIPELPSRQAVKDPTPETPITTEDANYMQYAALGGEQSFEQFTGRVVRERKIVEVPKVDMTKPPKAAEDSKTVRGIAKEQAGKEMAIAGATTIGTVATVVPNIQIMTGYIDKHSTSAILTTLGIIGFIILVYGAWRIYAGQQIKYEGRRDGEVAKV